MTFFFERVIRTVAGILAEIYAWKSKKVHEKVATFLADGGSKVDAVIAALFRVASLANVVATCKEVCNQGFRDEK